ncbi:hypothetical protein PGT21_013271 [Puccinia graminis f. sp. tritici]|uniref:Uncharacterized protein n=1 Tax=Puccinia graminis f. sp. tritici TaxID=56615 RepID=A0A5B0Q5H9_PUCGR|nr:hypothetical protein PGT21_013271 [Puccinia graminis f. sp. tritici]KAA1138605.1 hypothetical protein PGTUg99_030856 [Puccinia graminis f. sp. tritici]
MFSIFILVATMLLKSIAATSIIHPSDQIASVGENATIKPYHQHTKRMENQNHDSLMKCPVCGLNGLKTENDKCTLCKQYKSSGSLQFMFNCENKWCSKKGIPLSWTYGTTIYHCPKCFHSVDVESRLRLRAANSN